MLVFLAVSAQALWCVQNAGAALLPGADMAIGQKKQEAVTLLQDGRHDEAYGVFMQLLREDPEDADVNMGIAISAYATQRYAQSLMAYERLLAKYPHDSNLRVQIARVYVALDEPESARLELAKAKEYDPGLTDEQLGAVLAALAAKSSRWQHQGRLSFGFIHDSNSNQGPNSNFMTLGKFENLFVEGIRERESWGNYLSGSLELGYRLGDESPFWVMGDAMAYQRWNTSGGVTSNKSFTYGRTGLGLRYMGDRTLVDLRVKVDDANQHHTNAKDQDILGVGPELTFAVAAHPSLQFITRGAVEKRDYSETNQRDGTYWNAAQYARFFFGESAHEIMLGVTFTGNEPEVKAYRYLGVEPSLRFVFKLPGDVSFSPFVSFKEENYDGPATGLETRDRRDTQWRVGAMLGWDVARHLSLDLSYQYVDNDSNSALYGYRQSLINMGLTFKF